MPSGKQREYFHKKTQEALQNLQKVGTLHFFRDPIFNEALAIPIPKTKKVDSLETYLDNLSNVFNSILYSAEAGFYNALKVSDQASQVAPLASFCLEVLGSIIYKISELLPKDDKEIELQPMIKGN